MREGRTRGLDQANWLLSQAIAAYDRGDLNESQTLANAAVNSADQSTIPLSSTTSSTVVSTANSTSAMPQQPATPTASNTIYAFAIVIATVVLISIALLRGHGRRKE